MATKILTVLIIAVLFFLAYRYFTEGFQMRPSNFYSMPTLPERTVTSGGPSSPNVVLKESMATVIAEPETPNDPYDQREGSHPMQDSMRYPERSFGPAGQNSITDIATESGIASKNVQNVQE